MNDSLRQIEPVAVCDGGNLDCGSGLLLVIRKAMDSVPAGQVLEIRSTEVSVCEDLPAWCRMTANPFLGYTKEEQFHRFFVRRGSDKEAESANMEKARNYTWQCRVHWNGGLACTSYARNHQWPLGQPASFDVKDEAPSAVEYFLSALAGALVMGFQIEASRDGMHIEQAEMSLRGQLENVLVFLGVEQHGRSGFGDISGTLYVKSDADEKKLEAAWRRTVERSPIVQSLSASITLNLLMRVIP
jgi:TusA-related sulfurtransferase/uncharacterized OsmC-like protein